MFEGVVYSDLGYGIDIAPLTISLRDGWDRLEDDGAERFRTIAHEAQALFACAGGAYAISIDMEPAAVDSLNLEVRIDGALRYANQIRGRSYVRFVQPAGEAAMRRIALKAIGGSARIYRFAALPDYRDVVPQWLGFRVGGGGWYPLEELNREMFRYVNREANIVIGRPAKSLELDIEPGPGTAYGPFDLDILAGDRELLRRVRIERRMRITVELPELRSLPGRLVLSCQDGGRPMPPDARLMDFRLFAIPAPWERSELLRNLAALGPS
jgi:hypothetical protein